MKLSAEGVKAYDEILAPDPGRRTIAMTWSAATGAFFSEREKYYELSRARRARSHYEKTNEAIQEELNDIAAHPGTTASLQQALNFADAQD